MMKRWLLSTNAKDIGTFYLLFGAIAGFIGTALSMMIRLELASGGRVYLMGHYDTYNHFELFMIIGKFYATIILLR
jgi:cytochrome c oxidase subunit 1